MEEQTLKRFAAQIRLKTCEMLLHAGFGHLGGALSIVETLAVLYGSVMKLDPQRPDLKDRDWFVLSKGHGGPSYYAALALKGYFDESVLFTLNQNGTSLPSHPDRLKIRGVDVTTGSLGQGVSQAAGIAKGLRIQKLPGRVYCIVGDGECNEGQVWEAVQFAAMQRLDNFVLFVDDNKKQLDGYRRDVSLEADLAEIFRAFGYNTQTVDGADAQAIESAVCTAQTVEGKPHCIVLDTKKCQGIAYFEQLPDNHHIRFNEAEKKELQAAIDGMKRGLGYGNA